MICCEHRLIHENIEVAPGTWTKGRWRCDLCQEAFFCVSEFEAQAVLQQQIENQQFDRMMRIRCR